MFHYTHMYRIAQLHYLSHGHYSEEGVEGTRGTVHAVDFDEKYIHRLRILGPNYQVHMCGGGGGGGGGGGDRGRRGTEGGGRERNEEEELVLS